MLHFLLALQVITSVNQTGGITAGSVGNVTMRSDGTTIVERVDSFRCPDGNFPEMKNLHFTNCSTEFSTTPKKKDWMNKPSKTIIHRRHPTKD